MTIKLILLIVSFLHYLSFVYSKIRLTILKLCVKHNTTKHFCRGSSSSPAFSYSKGSKNVSFKKDLRKVLFTFQVWVCYAGHNQTEVQQMHCDNHQPSASVGHENWPSTRARARQNGGKRTKSSSFMFNPINILQP